MAAFVLNEEYTTQREIEAESFVEEGSFMVFRDGEGNQVAAIPTKEIHSILRKKETS